ncbi:hypothetical protein FN846DRAFT_170976 [Sphaerosporella brunnea]|uniref:Transmembrane protein n=1 Tax=Sphaerosporella brunnea TaxID=1250544 RepID=A0A5J5EQL6_9PEZI|nr:hypothetical protein FN846DRAFT_170976 [Sphaerosporella brunnea]
MAFTTLGHTLLHLLLAFALVCHAFPTPQSPGTYPAVIARRASSSSTTGDDNNSRGFPASGRIPIAVGIAVTFTFLIICIILGRSSKKSLTRTSMAPAPPPYNTRSGSVYRSPSGAAAVVRVEDHELEPPPPCYADAVANKGPEVRHVGTMELQDGQASHGEAQAASLRGRDSQDTLVMVPPAAAIRRE